MKFPDHAAARRHLDRIDAASRSAETTGHGPAFVAAGFTAWHTGGGCMAWGLAYPDGKGEAMVTDASGIAFPEVGGPILIGHYADTENGTDEGRSYECNTVAEALLWLAGARGVEGAEQPLCAELNAWQSAQGLPAVSADEHDGETLTNEQREWLNGFIARWNAWEAGERAHNGLGVQHAVADDAPRYFPAIG